MLYLGIHKLREDFIVYYKINKRSIAQSRAIRLTITAHNRGKADALREECARIGIEVNRSDNPDVQIRECRDALIAECKRLNVKSNSRNPEIILKDLEAGR